MKLEQAHIDQIRTAFEKMQSREDLLHVLNEAKPLVYGDKAVPFDLKQLTWYANPKLGRKRYAEFKIKKKSGAERCIHAPVKGLKSLQKTLSFVLQCVYEPHNAAMGFVRDRSIVDNAKLHVGSKYVFNIDLKDFFPSVDQARVWKCFQLKPFNLNKASSVEPQYMKWEDFKKEHLKTDEPVTFLKGKGRMFTNTPYGTLYVANNFDKEKDKYILLGSSSLKTKDGKSLESSLWLVNKIPDTSRLDIANIMASLCCTEMEVERQNDETGEWQKEKRNVLPQGAPTSPIITNIVCQRLDYLLSGVAKRFGLKYSRYADDITFSSMHNVYQPDSVFLKELQRIIAEQNFHIKESKTRLQKDGYRKEVTGLLVNEKANVQKRYIKQLRLWLYYWERYGNERASSYFLQKYIADKGNVKNGKPNMTNVISGKLDYLKMVKGGGDELYLKLKQRFDSLVNYIINDTKVEQVNVAPIKASKNGIPIICKKISELEDGIYKIIVNQNVYLINVTQLNIKVLDDAGKGIEKVSGILNDLYKMQLDFPENWLLYKLSNSIWDSDIIQTEKYTEANYSENTNYEVVDTPTIPIIHNPKALVSLLENFSNNDSALKYTTHSWDAGRDKGIFRDVEDFLVKARKEYSEFSFKLRELSENLNGKIYNFLFNKDVSKKGWGESRIKFGWSSPEIIIACNASIDLKPEDFIIPETFQLQIAGKTIKKFKQVIDVFKNEIEIRDENSALLDLILQKHDTYLTSFSVPIVTNLENKTFYTDIQWLSKALDLIFEGIQKYPQHNDVEYFVEKNNNDKIVLNILHKNSFKTGLSIHDDKLNLKRGDFSTIKDKLRNLCDWSIESQFAEGFYRINYLVSDEEISAHQEIGTTEGFKHILTFYK